MIDTPRVVTTPEGIELTLSVAGPVARARAWVIDALIRLVIYIAALAALSTMRDFGMGIFALIVFLLEWGYPVLCEVYWRGATPGKRACHLRVLYDDGTPVGWRGSVVRNTVRAVDFLPLFYSFGLVAMLLNRDFKRLGDLAAGTIVVHVPQQDVPRSRQVKPDVAQVSMGLAAPVVALTLAEQRAVVSFAERRWRWSDERAAELARHADALWGTPAGEGREGASAARVSALAAKLAGRAGATTGRVGS